MGYKVLDGDDIIDQEYPGDFVTRSQMKELRPDLIFIEGGMFDYLSGEARMTAIQIEHYVSAGAVVIIADVDWNGIYAHRDAYREVENLFGVAFGWDWRGEPAELFDDRWFVGGNRQILVQPDDIIHDEKFASIYKDLDPFIVGLPVPLRAWSQLIATSNKSTTKGLYNFGGHSFPEPVSAFAAAKQIGAGFVVLIAGDVSADVWVDLCPSNVTWLKRIAENLVEQVRIDRRRGKQTHQVFISHRYSMAQVAARFRNELRRRGLGTWLDVRKLIPGDNLTPEIVDAIEASTHFAVLWSKDCLDAPWIEFEMSKAPELGKRVFVMRFDDTAPPAGFEDHLRIEAQALTPEEIGRLVSLSIEREERSQK